MCLYPKMIRNPRYSINKKNGGNIPILADSRLLQVPIGCGRCVECRKQKARQWTIRLFEDIRVNKNGVFVTLTFSDESYVKLRNDLDVIPESLYKQDNAVATLAVRRYMERWRWKYKTTLRHWLVTELGGTGTERVHLHGIVWTDQVNDIKKIWQYGWVWTGDYVNERTINYIVKYLNKVDSKHKNYQPKMLVSAGIGSAYMSRKDSERHKYNKCTGKTIETYRTRTGHNMTLPKYYKNKIYSDDEKEILWIEKMDLKKKWVNGKEVDTSNGLEAYEKLLEHERMWNIKMGYGSDEISEDDKIYENNLATLRTELRMKKNKTWE